MKFQNSAILLQSKLLHNSPKILLSMPAKKTDPEKKEYKLQVKIPGTMYNKLMTISRSTDVNFSSVVRLALKKTIIEHEAGGIKIV